MAMRGTPFLAFLSFLVLAASAPACGTDAVGVEACREIENARCNRTVECGISLEQPRPAGDAVEACRRFYLDACLHGIQSAKDPTVAEKKACIEAITAGSCDVVREPQRAPACAFIIPPDTPADAGADTSTTDAKEPAPPVAQPDAAK
jgi:hypothetical protein